MKQQENLERLIKRVARAVVLIASLVLLLILSVVYLIYFYKPGPVEKIAVGQDVSTTSAEPSAAVHTDTLLNQDAETGFVINAGWELVKANCTGCHSAALVTQNRASREGWQGMIRWMQRTQKLWDLGENEDAILDYLAKNYAPDKKGRRENLKDIEWYELEAVPVSGDR